MFQSIKLPVVFLGIILLFPALHGQVKIGENIRDLNAFSLLELESRSKGLLIPRMTSAERDGAFNSSTPEGLLIFNTDRSTLQVYQEQIDKVTGSRTGGGLQWEDIQTRTVVPAGKQKPPYVQTGALFFDLAEQQLELYNGQEWIAIQGSAGGVAKAFDGELSLVENKLSLTGTPKTVDLSYLQEIIIGQGTPNATRVISPTQGDLYLDKLPSGGLYYYDGSHWKATAVRKILRVDATNGLAADNNTVTLGGALNKATTLSTSSSFTLSISGLSENTKASDISLLTVGPTGLLQKKSAGILFQQGEEIAEIVATEGQKQFTTPLAISSSKKIHVFRNGIRIDFTVLDTQTIEVEQEAVCYKNDQIRIVQYQ